MEVESGSLWFFKVHSVATLPAPVPSKLHCRRTVSKTFKVMDDVAAQALEDDLENMQWLPSRQVRGQTVTLAFVLPDVFADLTARGALDRVALPSPYSSGDFKAPTWFQKMLDPSVRQAFSDSVNPLGAGREDDVPFSLGDAGALAAKLREVFHGTESPDALVAWIVKLQQLADDLEPRTAKRRSDRVSLIHLLMFSDMLNSCDKLKTAIHDACKLALPSFVFDACKGYINEVTNRMPGGSVLSRFRLTVDTAMMFQMRVKHWRELTGDIKVCRYLTWDSSPQYHRDYEMTTVESIPLSEVATALKVAHIIYGDAWLRSGELLDPEGSTVQERHLEQLSILSGLIHIHALPPVVVGTSDFRSKMAALVHALRLEHFTAESLEKFCLEIRCILSDDGAESMLSRVKPCNLEDIVPYFVDTTPVDIARVLEMTLPNEDFDDLRMAQGFNLDDDDDVFNIDVPQHKVDLGNALGFSGGHHILHNATDGLRDAMPMWADHLPRAKNVCRLLRRPDMLTKLCARCYDSPLAKNMVPLLKAFRGHIHEARWGTIAFAVPELLKVQRTLQFGWDKARFIRGEVPQRGDDRAADTDMGAMVDSCDAAITSPLFWAWLVALDKLCDVLRCGICWLETCPCHAAIVKHIGDGDDGEDPVPKHLRDALCKCPLRARRAPELSTGALLQEVVRLCQLTMAQVVADLPTTLPQDDRRRLLQEMDAGRNHLIFYVTAKTAYLSEEPYSVVQLAHFDRDVAERAARRVLASRSPHPLL